MDIPVKLAEKRIHMHPTLSTHVLDTSLGGAAVSIGFRLEEYNEGENVWNVIYKSKTNADGRDPNFGKVPVTLGVYRLTFQTDAYFDKLGTDCFYPVAQITFHLAKNEHYHVPLLLSPFGFTTYRGT